MSPRPGTPSNRLDRRALAGRPLPDREAGDVDFRAPGRVAMVAFPSVQLLDVVGPFEVLAAAGRVERDRGLGPGSALEFVGPAIGSLGAASGLTLGVDRDDADRPDSIDTLIVAGGIGSRAASREARLLRRLGIGPVAYRERFTGSSQGTVSRVGV
jgi:transcriptional regulator GlxA family with amidase domain